MRTSSRVPSYRLHKPTGQAVVTLNGKDHYLGRHGTAASKEQYSRLIQEWLARGQQTAPEPGSTTGLTVNGLVLGYLRHAQEYYQKSPNELVKIKRAAAPLLQLYRRSPVGDFGPLALKAVRSKMLESQQRVFKRKVVENGVGENPGEDDPLPSDPPHRQPAGGHHQEDVPLGQRERTGAAERLPRPAVGDAPS